MRTSRWLVVPALLSLFAAPFVACSDDAGNSSDIQCDDGRDNDGDGNTDFPEDLSCDGADDLTEDGHVSPACKDGRDNDGDGKRDYPNDPGCFAPQQNSEEDDCPDGLACPQCANGLDDDGNGQIDFPSDGGGCTAASDTEEYTQNPIACGAGVQLKKVPFTGKATGMLMAGAQSNLTGACGGSGKEDVYEIRVTVPKVIVATTDNDGTMADTVLYIRSENCTDMTGELACNDNIDTVEKQSTVTASLLPGTYYLVVDAKDALGGAYDLSVNYFIGEGTQCFGPGDCGPGLICRVPMGQTQKLCSKHVCEDTVDEDGDGKNGYPSDPGCTSGTDDDEMDGCPGVGPNCPECGDGVDNDLDAKTDYGTNGDTTCTSASSASESCISTDGVTTLTVAATMDTTAGAVNDVKVACATSGTHTAGDRTYRLDLPAMSNLTINNTNSFDAAVALYNSTCGGTALLCDDEPEDLTSGPLAAGAYYYVVDGYSSGTGAYTITVSGQIAPNQSCESPLAQAGAITCSLGYACQGTTGSRTCQPAVCFDTQDNDNDMKADYPLDPGCDSPADTNEMNPASPPVCANGTDDDGDNQTDYPNDFGCASASGTSEAFCSVETDTAAKITAKVTTGTTAAKSNDHAPACASSTAPDVSYALNLPVPVATLQIDTIGSGFDTILLVKNLDCQGAVLGCDDEGGGSNNSSKIVMNGVAPGGYAVIVDGWLSNSGTFTLNVFGTVAPGTRCDSPLFSGGTAAVLSCPNGTTCTGAPTPKCQ